MSAILSEKRLTPEGAMARRTRLRRADPVAVAKDLRDLAYNEGNRANAGGAAIIGALSQLAALGAVIAAWAGGVHGAPLGTITLGLAGMLFVAAAMLVNRSLRPRLPGPAVRHGWAPLLRLDADAAVAYVHEIARDAVTAYVLDAKALTHVAHRKHRLFRAACTCLECAFPLAVGGGALLSLGV